MQAGANEAAKLLVICHSNDSCPFLNLTSTSHVSPIHHGWCLSIRASFAKALCYEAQRLVPLLSVCAQ